MFTATAKSKEMIAFEAIVQKSKDKRGSYIYECPRGLWGVSSSEKEQALSNAFHYFEQYLEDGEYDDLLSSYGISLDD